MATDTPAATSNPRGIAKFVLFLFAVVVALILCSLLAVNAFAKRVLAYRVCRFGSQSATVSVIHDWHNAVVIHIARPGGEFSSIQLAEEKAPEDKARIDFDERTGEIAIYCGQNHWLEELAPRTAPSPRSEPQVPEVEGR